jgi:hypothetical protein
MFNLFARRQPQAQRNDRDPARHPVIAVRPANVPPTIITARQEPLHPTDGDPQTFVQYNVAENVELAPQPVPYTQFWNVGRDPAHAWPRMNLYQFMSPRDWLSVAGWPFSSVGHTQAGSMVTQPRGRFIPQLGRSNINSPGQTSLGAQTAVQAPIFIDPNHINLIL